MTTSKKGLSNLAQLILKDYRTDTRGHERFLTDPVKRAFVARAAHGVMLARYEVEAERATPTSPNVYVEAVIEVERFLEL